jgi:glutamate dehydrogenase/leucine dehydrogenase
MRSGAVSAEPYLRVVWTDPVTGRNGYLVIDRLVRGIAGGGTRVRRGVRADEVARLAHTMTLKNGFAERSLGRSQGGPRQRPRGVANGWWWMVMPENTERIAREYGTEEAKIPATAAP